MKYVFLLISALSLLSCEFPINEKDLVVETCQFETLKIDESGFKNGPFSEDGSIDVIALNDDGCLVVTYRFGGGCEMHTFTPVTNGQLIESNPPVLEIAIQHNDKDQCEALITESLEFSYSSVEELNNLDQFVIKAKGSDVSLLIEK